MGLRHGERCRFTSVSVVLVVLGSTESVADRPVAKSQLMPGTVAKVEQLEDSIGIMNDDTLQVDAKAAEITDSIMSYKDAISKMSKTVKDLKSTADGLESVVVRDFAHKKTDRVQPVEDAKNTPGLKDAVLLQTANAIHSWLASGRETDAIHALLKANAEATAAVNAVATAAAASGLLEVANAGAGKGIEYGRALPAESIGPEDLMGEEFQKNMGAMAKGDCPTEGTISGWGCKLGCDCKWYQECKEKELGFTTNPTDAKKMILGLCDVAIWAWCVLGGIVFLLIVSCAFVALRKKNKSPPAVA